MSTAQDYFAHAIGLQFAIQELRRELTVDVCQECPRLVTLALDGLQSRVDQLVISLMKACEEKTEEEVE